MHPRRPVHRWVRLLSAERLRARRVGLQSRAQRRRRRHAGCRSRRRTDHIEVAERSREHPADRCRSRRCANAVAGCIHLDVALHAAGEFVRRERSDVYPCSRADCAECTGRPDRTDRRRRCTAERRAAAAVGGRGACDTRLRHGQVVRRCLCLARRHRALRKLRDSLSRTARWNRRLRRWTLRRYVSSRPNGVRRSVRRSLSRSRELRCVCPDLLQEGNARRLRAGSVHGLVPDRQPGLRGQVRGRADG